MGATITCGKKVGILAHDDGQHSIVLFEETPHPKVGHEGLGGMRNRRRIARRCFFRHLLDAPRRSLVVPCPTQCL